MVSGRIRIASAALAAAVILPACGPGCADGPAGRRKRPTPPRRHDAIGLTLHNDLGFARPAEPVTCGVPLARGFCGRAATLGLVGPDGSSAPTQAVVTGRYRDGSPRWVLLDFQADLPPAGKAVYRLVPQPAHVAPPAKLSYRLREGVAMVDTGAAQFRIDTRRFRLFDSVKVAGVELIDAGAAGRGAVLTAESGRRLRADEAPAKAEFEDAGPMRVTLAVRGEIGPPGQGPRLARYICRMWFYAGKSEVRVFFTLHNPAAQAHPGNVWDLGSGGSVFLEDFSLLLPLRRLGERRCQVGLQADGRVLGGNLADPVLLYQDSSGGVNWRSANHCDKDLKVRTSFRGYRVLVGGQRVAEGERADGYLAVRGDRGGLAVAVRELWQNFPKALDLKGGRLRVGLWPGEFAGVHELLGGEQKTHEMLLVFHGPEAAPRTVERRMKAFHRPAYAMPDPEAVIRSGCFWRTGPLQRSRHKKLEQTCDTFVSPRGRRAVSVMTQWERIDEYGWRHFGDTWADNEHTTAAIKRDHPAHHIGHTPIGHYGNEYEVTYTLMLQGLRRGEPRWMWLADVMSRHYADICVYHTDVDASKAYSHGPFTHTTHGIPALRSTHRMYPSEGRKYRIPGFGGGPNAGHCYVSHLAQHFYLTGDRISREAFLEVAGHWCLKSPWFRNRMMGDRRGLGNFLTTFVTAYRLTGRREYYDAAMKVFGWADPADLAVQQRLGQTATLFARAASRFLDMKKESDEIDADYGLALGKLLACGDALLACERSDYGHCVSSHCTYAEVLFLCHLHAPEDHPRRRDYYEKGLRIMNEAEPKWAGQYTTCKDLVMCFSNVGAYLHAQWLRTQQEAPAGPSDQ